MSPQVLTSDGRWLADDWKIVREADRGACSETGATLLPLSLFLSQPASISFGVWLGPTDEPAALELVVDTVERIAIDFPKFSDGRGYSIAYLLRTRYGYKGELRAVGDVLIDQLFYLRRAGFSSFALRGDQDRIAALAALSAFSEVYQASVAPSLPAFRRQTRPNAKELAATLTQD